MTYDDDFKLVDIGNVFDDTKRKIRVTDGVTTETCTAVLIHNSDYRREWEFYAYGKKRKMIGELYFDRQYGTCLQFFID